MENETIISLRDIVVDFDGEQVLRHINLDIRNHEFVTLLGPSGCGKTTTLRIIGGFITPNSGDVFFDGKKINSLPPYKREVNTVFQKYALFPNLNVFENIAFGLRLKKIPDKEIKERVFEMLDLVSMRGYERRDVNSLSGGQQQRVAIARALAAAPAIILADEPTGNLDSRTSQDVLSLLKVTSQKFAQTIVMITHNEEIAQMADRMIRIEDGRIVSRN